MKLVLDEMLPPAIAEQLRARGHDVIAATETEHHARYGSIADTLVFERAQEDQRAVVTDNASDFVPLVAAYERRDLAHHGLVLCSSGAFDRADPRTIGRMVDALDALLTDQHSSDANEPFNQQHWLRRTK